MGFLIAILLVSFVCGIVFLLFSGKRAAATPNSLAATSNLASFKGAFKAYLNNLLTSDYIAEYYDNADAQALWDTIQLQVK
jgi:hypothetical protein